MLGYISTSIRRKLTFVMLGTAVVALLVTATAMIIYEARTYHETWINDLVTQAEIIGQTSAPALSFDDPKTARENLSVLRLRPLVTAAAIYTADGRLFADYTTATGVPAALPLNVERNGYRIQGDQLSVFQEVRENGQVLGTVYLRAGYELRNRLLGYLAIVGLSILASLVVTVAVTAWLQRAITEPVLGVARVAQQVMERRDYKLRVRKTSTDEVGVLVDAFNDMLAEADKRATALETANADLLHEMHERQAAEDALKSADQRKDEFLATLAHELRNPLAPIRNGLQIMRMTSDADAIARAQLMMERQLQQMVRLVDDLLDVSRITTGKLVLRTERVSLREVMVTAIDAVRPLVDAKRHTLSVDLPANSVELDADPTRLSQILSNILNNAVKYTEPGGSIRVTARLAYGAVEIRVSDTGIGIAADKLPAVFEMFTQFDASPERMHGGLGVGLALAKRLVQLHGGTITVSSDGLGHGSEFTVRLPVATAPVSALGANVQRRESAAPRRVLLVDDNRDFALSLAALLELEGHDVRTTFEAISAETVAEEFHPDIAFLDLGLPNVNGFELARRLRAQPKMNGTVLVAVTGWGKEEDRRRSREAGFDLHLVKPVEPDQILDEVR
ncbi:MAG TPA: ATP-binding protein, partial [Burkholderiaceae bacterium]|nr:ATP-binding protein [Burkholderiaceae bacterium]